MMITNTNLINFCSIASHYLCIIIGCKLSIATASTWKNAFSQYEGSETFSILRALGIAIREARRLFLLPWSESNADSASVRL